MINILRMILNNARTKNFDRIWLFSFDKYFTLSWKKKTIFFYCFKIFYRLKLWKTTCLEFQRISDKCNKGR